MGALAQRAGEYVRRAVDLEHWAAFQDCFLRVAGLLRAVGSGEYGRPPATITMLSCDVHHAYLVERLPARERWCLPPGSTT